VSEPTAAGPNAGAGEAVPFARFLRYFLGLGTWGFGGPIATVGYMQRDLVERRGWVSRQEFVNGVALGQTMPGPEGFNNPDRITRPTGTRESDRPEGLVV